MRGNQNETSGDLLFVSIKGLKDGEKAHFELKKGNGKGEPMTEEKNEQNLSGLLVKAEHRVWDYKGVPTDSIVLYLKDEHANDHGGETYKIEAGMSGVTRGLINSLLSAESFDQPLFLGLYNNKKGYSSLSVGLGADDMGKPIRLDWKYDVAFFKSKVTTTTVKAKDEKGNIVDKQQNNYLELNDYLIKEFVAKVIPVIAARKGSAALAPVAEDAAWPTPKQENKSVNDDLPF